jgi:hypothetical protein
MMTTPSLVVCINRYLPIRVLKQSEKPCKGSPLISPSLKDKMADLIRLAMSISDFVRLLSFFVACFVNLKRAI